MQRLILHRNFKKYFKEVVSFILNVGETESFPDRWSYKQFTMFRKINGSWGKFRYMMHLEERKGSMYGSERRLGPMKQGSYKLY